MRHQTYRKFIPGFHLDGRGEVASCATCKHFGETPPRGRMPGVGRESRECNRPRINGAIRQFRRPTDWCDQWEDAR